MTKNPLKTLSKRNNDDDESDKNKNESTSAPILPPPAKRMKATTTLMDEFTSNTSSDNILKLIEVEGRDLVMKKDEKGSTALMYVFEKNCSSNISFDVISKLIEVGGQDLVAQRDEDGCNALHLACKKCNTSYIDLIEKMIEKMIEVGGQELVLQKDGKGSTTLDYALENKDDSYNTNTIIKLIDVGGQELLMNSRTHKNGTTVLHNFCQYHDASDDVIIRMIEAGGEKFVMKSDKQGRTALHYACLYKASPEVVSALVKVGGKKFVMQTDRFEVNALHKACTSSDDICDSRKNKPSFDVIDSLLTVGGKKLALQADCYVHEEYYVGECTALHRLILDLDSFEDFSSSEILNILDRLVEVGEAFILNAEDQRGYNAIRRLLFSSASKDIITHLISKYIKYQIGGEFNIGGLFDSKYRNRTFENWDSCIVPILKQDMNLFSFEPILHAAIYHGAPCNVIVDILNRFDGCCTQKDSMGRFPMDVAIEEAEKRFKEKEARQNQKVVVTMEFQDPEDIFYNSDGEYDSVLGEERWNAMDFDSDDDSDAEDLQKPSLTWKDGMQDIVTALAASQGRLMIHVALEHGLPWDFGMKDVIDLTTNEQLEERDAVTGLYPFMLAAIGEKCSLRFIYELGKQCPQTMKRLE